MVTFHHWQRSRAVVRVNLCVSVAINCSVLVCFNYQSCRPQITDLGTIVINCLITGARESPIIFPLTIDYYFVCFGNVITNWFVPFLNWFPINDLTRALEQWNFIFLFCSPELLFLAINAEIDLWFIKKSNSHVSSIEMKSSCYFNCTYQNKL